MAERDIETVGLQSREYLDKTQTWFVVPASGRFVRHPHTMRPLREEGEEVGRSDRFYWNRMIQTGDVIVVPRSHAATTTPSEKKED